ncbi:MAG: PQQ-dependent sugar dehydrogenase [Segetibacter sp.]
MKWYYFAIAQPYENHNGGKVAFGNDGFLYIAAGDGGSGGDPGNRGQNRKELLGKILRIDVNKPSGNLNYSIPADNPFAKEIKKDFVKKSTPTECGIPGVSASIIKQVHFGLVM